MHTKKKAKGPKYVQQLMPDIGYVSEPQVFLRKRQRLPPHLPPNLLKS